MEKKLWFKAKSYGWGWYPATWQGWAVIGLYLVGVYAGVALLEGSPAFSYLPVFFCIYIGVLTIFLVLVSYLAGEKPEWRWGRKATEQENNKQESDRV